MKENPNIIRKPVLFLDIDGVLNCNDWFVMSSRPPCEILPDTEIGRYMRDIDPVAVERLNRIIQETGAVVVVSSTWRLLRFPKVPDILQRRGFVGQVIDATPNHHGAHRGGEISAWLDAHPEVTTFAVVDDDTEDITDTPRIANRFVHTPQNLGLQDEHVEKLIALLNTTELGAA